MKNTGTASPANDWTVAGSYQLYTIDGKWSWSFTPVPATVVVGSQQAFSMVVTAPTTLGGTTFQSRMRAGGGNAFGDTVSYAPTVSTATTPDWGCTYVPGSSTLPTTMTPGETRTVTITVQNSGSQSWDASTFALYSRDSPVNFWAQTISYVKAPVAAGGTTSFTFNIVAPSTAGTYSFRREMRALSGIGYFRLSGFCVDTNITVGGAALLDSSLVSTTFPASMNTGDFGSGTVTLTNTGTEAWQADGNYVLYSLNSPTNLWGVTQVAVTAVTPQGSNFTFNLGFQAPSTAGTYSQVWQMRKLSGTVYGPFGASTNVPITVSAGASNYDAAVGAQTIPALMTAGKPYTFSIQMQNSGSSAWTGSDFVLFSTSSPANLWSVVQSPLGASETIANGASKTFSIGVTAPAAAGTYSSSWRMRQLSGVGYFGSTATTNNLVVTLCGNSTVDAGEACDDGNLNSGDGCSNQCQWEQTSINLASQSSSRTLIGSTSNVQLAAITLGDVTGDGTPEVFVSEYQPPAGTGTSRGGAGAVYGMSGGASFLNGSSTTMPSGATLQIAGAEGGDGLGVATTGRIAIGEVTGDTIKDLVVSASGADGPSNGRSNCGEVYVLTGGSALMSAGLVDLAASPTQMKAHIIGKNAGDGLSVIAIGDLTGDSQPDLLLGAQADGTNGTNAGAIYIVAGGASLTGDIDLASPPGGVTVYRILGRQAGDQLGANAAIGDLDGDTHPDLLAGTPLTTTGGRTRTGAAFARFGVISGNLDFAQAVGSATGPSAMWLGKGSFDGFGGAVAIGNVTGTSQGEAVIGAIQYQRAPNVQSGGASVWSGVTSGTTYDQSAGATPTMQIVGADQYDDCGTAVALGDMNNDSYQDVIMTCSAAGGPTNTLSKSGEAHVVMGGATVPATYDLLTRKSSLVVYSALTNDLLGRYITTLSATDIDGDGHADFCVGTRTGGNASTHPGRIDCVLSTF